MKITIRKTFLVLPLCGVLAASVLSGCEDAESRQRVAVQAKLDQAAASFRGGEYSRVVSELSAVTEGGPGQQAARGLLLADSLRELGLRQLADAERLELEHRRQRDRLRGRLAGLLRLEATAQALAATTTDPQRIALQRQLDEIDRQLGRMAHQVSEAEGPISTYESRIALDQEEVARIRDEANRLLHEAMNRGHAAGLGSLKESVAMRRRADQIEYRAALSEIDLSQQLKPDREHARMVLEQSRSMVEAIRAALRELEEFERLFRDQSGQLRTQVAELRQAVHEGTQAIASARSSDVEPFYEQAMSQLERAASESSRAAGQVRAEAGAARLSEARSREALGRTHWSQARGIGDHMLLLSALIAAGPAVGNTAGYQAQLEALSARHHELVESARSAYEAAMNAVEQAGRVQGADGYRHMLQAAVALLSGREADLTPPRSEYDFDLDAAELPFDPAMLEGMEEVTGKEALLAALDQMDFDTVAQMFESMGMADPAMIQTLREPYSRAVAAVRTRVESGEITDGSQLEAALMEEMMKAMGFGG